MTPDRRPAPGARSHSECTNDKPINETAGLAGYGITRQWREWKADIRIGFLKRVTVNIF